MKKLLIIAVIITAVIVGAPLYTGKRTQSEIENFASQLETWLPNTKITIADYDKGLFSATGKLVLVNTEERSWRDNPLIELIKHSGEQGLTFDISTSHGLIVTNPSFKLGLGHATFSLNNADNEMLSEITELSGLKTILTNDMSISLTGNATNNLSIPTFTAKKDKNSLSFGGLNVDVSIDKEKRFDLKGTFGATEMKERRDNFTSAPITFSAKGQLGTEEWPVPTGTFELQADSIDIGREGAASKIYVKGSITESNNLLSSMMKLTADKLTLPDGQSFSNIDYDVNIGNIDKASIQNMISGEVDEETAFMSLLQASPQYTINKIAIDAGDLGKLDLSGNLSIDGEQLKELTSLDDINSIINAVTFKLDSEFNVNAGNEVTIDNSTIRFEIKDKTYDMNIAIGAIGVPSEGVSISPISMDSKGKWKESIWVPNEKTNVAIESMQFADEVSLKDLKMSSLTTSDNGLMNGDASYSLGKFTSQKPAIDLSDTRLDLSISNISEPGIIGAYNLTYSQDAIMKLMTGDEKLMAEVNSLAKMLVTADPTISAEKITFTLGQDSFNGNANMKLDQAKLAGVDSLMENPQALQLALIANAKATFSQNLPLAMTEVKINDAYHYGLNEDEIAQMKQEELEGVSAMLQQVVEQGFLSVDGDNYTVDIQFKDGQLTLNGQAVPF